MSAPDTSATPASPAAVDRENPWPGLGSYDESMHGFFFGRDAEVEELLRLVRRDPVALFYGQSGLGKSSLLQAGLFPRLRAADLMPVHIRLRFGAGFPHPVAQILQEVAVAAHRAGGEAPAAAEGGTLFEYFYDETHEFWSARNRVLTPVIVFDQFEEIFTLGARDSAAVAHRDELLAQLADLAARRAPAALVARFEHHPELASRYALDRTRCRLLFSLREDFLPELGSLRDHLPTLASGGLRLQRLRGHQAREVLEKPGAHLLEPDTTERIIRFVAAEQTAGGAHELSELEVEPALLNVVARELNNRRRARGLERISADLVQGARDEILVDFYERAFAGLEPHVREFVEDQLLTTTGFRDSVAVEDAEASYRVSGDMLAVLVDRRLLRIDERFQMQRVELTHDLLAGVVKASRDSRRAREATAAERRRAEEAKQAAEQAAAVAQARLRHTRMRALVTIVMGALAVGIGGLMYLNHRKADEARRLDAERQAAIEARLAADAAREEARTSLQRADEAMAASLLIQADATLAAGGFDTAQLLLQIGRHKGIIPADSLAWFSAALNQPRVLSLEGYLRLDEPVVRVEFAPGGRLVAVTWTGTVRFITVAPTMSAAARLALVSPVGDLAAVVGATSIDVLWEDRPLLAIGTRSRTVQIHDLESGALVRVLRVPGMQSAAAASNPADSATKADTAAADPAPVLQATDSVQATRFSPTGRSLAAVISDGLLTVWHLVDSAEWSLAPQGDKVAADVTAYATNRGDLGSSLSQLEHTAILWAADGSLIVSTATATSWFTRPKEAWSSEAPIERFNAAALLGAVRPFTDVRSSEWFVANSKENGLYWLSLPPDSEPGSTASRTRTSESLADTIHAIAAMPGADVVFTALRNGTIAVSQSDSTTSQPTLKVIQTTTTGRAGRMALRLRPDGRYLAAIGDDDTVCLYRVSIPPALARRMNVAEGLMHDEGTWLLGRGDGTIVRADGTEVGTWPYREPEGTVMRIAFVPSLAAAAQTFAFVTQGDLDGTAPVRCGMVRMATGEMLWSRPLQELGPITEASLSAVAFSKDGSVLAVSTAAGTILRLNSHTGELLGDPLVLGSDIQHVTWSGDGRRIAAANDRQDIAIFEPETSARPVVELHARHSRLSGFALDAPGHTLAYTTAEPRLVLERFAPGQRRASLSSPLDAPVSHVGLAEAGPDRAASIAMLMSGRLRVVSGSLPDAAEIEWSTLATIQGYEAVPHIPPTDAARISSAVWSDDSLNLEAASLLRDTYAWINTAASRFASGAESPRPDELEKLRIVGDTLRQRFDLVAPRQPAFAAIRDRLAKATADLVAFSTDLAPALSPLRRWPIVAYQESIAPGTGLAATFAAEQALAAVIAEVGARTETSAALPPATRAIYQEIVRAAANSGRADEALWTARAKLTRELFTLAQWADLIVASPSAYLIDREANAQATAGDMETSNRLYLELERRDPEALTYPIRRGNNLRRMGQRAEALGLFDRVAAAAAASGDGEVEAEARVYRAWTHQRTEGRLQDARTDMIAAARLAPTDPWTLRNVVEFVLEYGPPADAVGPAADLVQAQDTAANRILQARVLLAAGDGAGARSAVEPLAASDDIAMRLDVVELLSASASYADHSFAAEWAHAAYQTTNDRALEERALRHLGPLWLATDELVSARNALNRLLDYKLSLQEQATIHALMGRIDMRRRQFASAREAFETALRLDPAPATRVRRDFACLLAWTGDTAGALAQFRQAAAGGDAEDALALVQATQRLDTTEAAGRALAEALARFPDDRPLRLARAWSLLASDPVAARHELAGLDDGSRQPVDLMAAALLGRAAEAATLHLTTLGEAYADGWMLQTQLETIAYGQTRESRLRLEALQSLSIAINRGFRGDIPLLALPGFAGVADDTLFQLAGSALALPADSRDGLMAIARFNLRTAALVEDQGVKSSLLKRAGNALSRGVALEVFTPADVLADPELAPFAGQF